MIVNIYYKNRYKPFIHKKIGNFAFCRCSSLTKISIPSFVVSIGDCTFSERNQKVVLSNNSCLSDFLIDILINITIYIYFINQIINMQFLKKFTDA